MRGLEDLSQFGDILIDLLWDELIGVGIERKRRLIGSEESAGGVVDISAVLDLF